LKKKWHEVVFAAKRRDTNPTDLLIKQTTRNLELKILQLEQKLTALIDNKTQNLSTSLANTQNQLADNWKLRHHSLEEKIAA